MKVKETIISLILLTAIPVQAQIVIGGNVYGGGNAGDVGGNTSVSVYAGDLNRVFGGARMADVGGSASVHIDGEHMTDDILINYVYGGNDIAGTITTSASVQTTPERKEMTGTGNETVTTQPHNIFIGQLFGGGNGDYDYSEGSDYDGKTRPDLGRTSLELRGGTIAYVYGGGNNATVTEATDIRIDNSSAVTTAIPAGASDADNKLLQNGFARLSQMGIGVLESVVLRDTYQFSRVFGGNNKAEMSIMPVWHLENGKIDNLYSGGNEGNMTSPTGLLLEIPATSNITVNNLYGGCRKADVRPMRDGVDVTAPALAGYRFPEGLPAHVRILGGNINNVYGGNDISGKVWGGSSVGIYHSIIGDVYGGGNGSYAYTDKESQKSHLVYGDFYYDPHTAASSVEALNAFRPVTESVSLFVSGTETEHTIIGGSIYCGGNSTTLRNDDPNTDPYSELKIGPYVYADNVFLGNNGVNMIDASEDGVLRKYADSDYSTLDLTQKTQFDKYMEAVSMNIKPRVVFDDTYVDYSTYFGSFFGGGNVGSITYDGLVTLNFDKKIIIYSKVVGGCNNADVAENSNYNARYEGGITGAPDAMTGNKLVMNFNGLKIQPKRWKDASDKSLGLVWNTISARTGEEVDPVTSGNPGESTQEDIDRRLTGGNIYGGCYNSGHINGNVVININASLEDRTGAYAIFDVIAENEGEAILYDNRESGQAFSILERRSGVILNEQGMDVLGRALNVFGGGYGAGTEIWGSTTININQGYVFQVFGGGEAGVIGRKDENGDYIYNPLYSTCINLRGGIEGVYRGHTQDTYTNGNQDMAEAEFIYGGGFFGKIVGDTRINLGNGRIFNSFAGSCNADILGNTETYIGRNSNNDSDLGFPWIRDHVYGGNDLGGLILNTGNKTYYDRVTTDTKSKVYNPAAAETPLVTKASSYIEYVQGRADFIFGGCYGYYDYTDRHFQEYTNEDGSPKAGFSKPRMDNAFVNFKPNSNSRNDVAKVYGAGQGYSGEADRDLLQDRSYVLIDIPQSLTNFQDMEVFGAGDYGGVGMRITPEVARSNADGVTAATVVDLVRGQIKDVFGASYKEGVTRRTIVNVPTGSTIHLNRIFGGGYGVTNEKPCDVYEANVNYHSADAIAAGDPYDIDANGYQTAGGVYGGNNNCRRTLYAKVNIDTKVASNETGYTARVFGGGYGKDTWAQYTEVNLNDGADVYEVYGGGFGGMVLNKESVDAWSSFTVENENLTIDKTIGTGYTDEGLDGYLVTANTLDGMKCNANVHIKKGAWVGNYAYGGGLGTDATVSGSTYIELLGGTVKKDLYAGGTSGGVMDKFKLGNDEFVATTNAYIEGGTVRNVYGGGWEGNVGYTKMENGVVTENIPGKTNVVIGIRKDQNIDFNDSEIFPDGYGFYKGIPAIQRNAYAGGEGGAVYGQANLTFNNGYIGFVFDNGGYVEKLHDETWVDHVGLNRLSDCGNIFGGGYDDNSSVDKSHVTLWGGIVRNCVFGGGEIATIGRGSTRESGEDNKIREIEAIYQAGQTHVTMYNGHVKRNVFGGGKGYNILGYGGVHGFYTDGYVFGQTEVYIHGGEIGTGEGLAEGYGNVFGGGDVGYVYSKGYFNAASRLTGTGSPNHYYYYDETGHLTEDCKVIVSPMLQVRESGTPITFGGETYGPYDYVPTDYLNTLPADKTATGWMNLYTGDKLPDGTVNPDDPDERGIHIRNAVFAGGNVSSNSESYNNATTVFGNTTATLYDVFHRDFITVGTEHTGGLYGGGNLSVVDGYRELNITNYGTDYYGMDEQISLEQYQTLTNRERAYFKLEYQCQQAVTIEGKAYQTGDRISEDEYNALPASYRNTSYWIQYGFCSIYAGRLLNTIQRADFCGVYGSRLVLQGAKDRVADVADATEYTINRVGEVSLNRQLFVSNNTEAHGNYFGIYSVVNYMGNLTSDVKFTDKYRYVERGDVKEDASKSYYDWKTEHLGKRERNNGTSYNQVALASGVFLELTSETSTPTNKVYGDITGIVELDLINVKKDIEGGGFVYARNEHGVSTLHDDYENVILSEYNKARTGIRDEARTHKRFTYDDSNRLDHQTSGNFIHKSKRIVDDCYPNNGVYNDYEKSPAHYWFIKGEVYIYDQIVSAYAGSASAYSKEVKIPLTITAGSNGKLQLLNVQPSLYAYYADEVRSSKISSDGVKVDNERMTYHLNDVISWWDWNQLSQNEQKYFVKDTYVNVDTCYVGGEYYPSGTYVLENDASVHGGNGSQTAYQLFLVNHPVIHDKNNQEVTDLTTLFHPSNNISHANGYVLTLDMNSPKDWDDWYSPVKTVDGGKITKETYNLQTTDKSKYREGPTFTLTGESGLYGQREYGVGEIVSKEVYDDYTSTVGRMAQQPTGQASVEPAYVALADFGNTQAGNAISETEYNALADKSNFAPAMVCVNTLQIGETEYLLMGELVSATDENLNALAQQYMTYNNGKVNADRIDNIADALEYVKSHLSDAYCITSDGLYGGQYFEAGENFSAIKSWCSLTDTRHHFNFNYDAFDVLVDPDYHGEGYTSTYYRSPYSDVKPVEYEAAYDGTDPLTYYDNDGTSHTVSSGAAIDREAYEKVRNDQLHYTKIQVDKGADTQTVYIAKENMLSNGTPYAKGQELSEKDYRALSDANKAKVDIVELQKETVATVKYYCYETYSPATTFSTEKGTAGEKGSIISQTVFNDFIPNYQKFFTIQGTEPTETTTLYVSRESNAKDLTSEKVITVVYQYTYYEPDDEGEGVSLVNELHVLNIHLQMENGAPEIGQLNTPPAVLPGNTLGMKAPAVNPGLYEVLTSGWELFNSEDDAMLHRNGIPFTNNGTPLYWYQNQKVWLAFYSKTYLGKTYSNYVPLTVANYHDLDAVMADKEHHLYVDHPDVMRNSKIYIDNRICESDPTKSELDLLKDFFDLSVNGLTGHSPLDSHVKGGADLEFILNSDVSPKAYTNWTPVGNAGGQCFEGTLHGDGYTVSGLSNSLFGNLCGSVYNLGVTGSFTSAGVVDEGEGYVENCWINTTGTPDGSVKAVFGNPSGGSGTQIANCYYPATKTYNTTSNGRGLARPMSETDFYNGMVAYNLNGFYLNKRYYDKQLTSGSSYQYLKSENGILQEQMSTGYYPSEPDWRLGNVGYVENRYKDGDFIYAAGSIPDSYDERMRVTHDGNSTIINYVPIWPDDYIFFGQTLTYGYNSSRPHNDLPVHVNKSGGRLPLTTQSNRVYRAPAYYQNKTKDMVHFNLWANLAAYSKPLTVTDTNLKPAYPDMTAVDFNGHGDTNYGLGLNADNHRYFYLPLLDNEDGLLSIVNNGETPNLLVYAPDATKNAKTHEVLSDYFVEPVYTDYYINDNTRRVNKALTTAVDGHLVQSNLVAVSDHLLVDKRDFNCPIAYRFADDKRMWYQRTPDRYVSLTEGWETVSLPFAAELVTTHQKGEITHFYSGSRSVDGETKIGHEYWLREYKGKKDETGDTFTAIFNYPTSAGHDADKRVTNTFLWDYYYSAASQEDVNTDTYQTYYREARNLQAYPLLTQAKPYIIGFPGKTYYEFDLSGQWTAQHTATPVPSQLDRQVISFVSETGITIGVSDDEQEGTAQDGYIFKPNYSSKAQTGYLLNADGNRFEQVVTPAALVPFRPYFVAGSSSSRRSIQYITFDSDDSSFAIKDERDPSEGEVGGLTFFTKRHQIGVTSSLREAADVEIYNVNGHMLLSFTVQPGETIERDIPIAAVYIVRAANGRYTKKLAVK